METLREPTKTKARTQHRCSYCAMFINKGDVYNKSAYKNDGDIYTWKAHLECDEIAVKLKMHESARDSGYEGVTGEWFDETIRMEYNDIMIDRGYPETKENKYPSFIQRFEAVLIHHHIKPIK